MRWLLATIVLLSIVTMAMDRPWSHMLRWDVEAKTQACLRAVEEINKFGYRILLGEGEASYLSEDCPAHDGAVYCLFLPGTHRYLVVKP